jgi:ESS family glutamate:Na+ symporter
MEKWTVIIYFLFMGVLLFVGKVLKTKLPFLNRIVLPTALLGGALGLLFSSVVIPGSYTIDTSIMTTIVYHCLALGFISLTLKQGRAKGNKKIWSTGMVITSTYALQGFIGILLVLIFFSDKFVGSGLLLALGFGQGPGLAQSFGGMWTEILGGHGAALGVSYAVIGFVVGGTIGVLLINLLSRKKNIAKTKRYYDTSLTTHEIKIDTVKEVSVMDGLTIQIVIISIIYFLVWGTLYLLSGVLTTEAGGTIGDTVYGIFEGFNFILGIFYAMLFKVILRVIQKTGKNVNFMTNDYVLSNLSSYFFNIMICGAVLTITFDFLSSYGWLLAIVASVGAILTLLYLRIITKKIYNENNDEYFVGLFGMLTGTASTGIALLKGLDKNLETPVAEELVLGSGTAIAIALPLFVILMLPSLGYDVANGVLIGANANKVLFEYIALFGCLLYFLVVVTILILRARKPKTVKTE